ncbi:MAG: DUF2933 domain-containing protein [Pseudomonadota bacterium]
MSNRSLSPNERSWGVPGGIVFLVFVGIGGFLMYHGHQAHIPGGVWLLIGFLAVCVLVHVFMHGGHGGTDDHNQTADGGEK